MEVSNTKPLALIIVAQQWNSQSGNSNSTTKYIKALYLSSNNSDPIPLRYNKDSGYMYELFWSNNSTEVAYNKYFNLNYNGNLVMGIPFYENTSYSGSLQDILLPIYGIYYHNWLQIENNFIIITN